MPMRQNLSRMTAEEAESLIFNGAMVAVSGLAPAGAPGRAAGMSRLGRVLHRAGTAIGHRLLRGLRPEPPVTTVWPRPRP